MSGESEGNGRWVCSGFVVSGIYSIILLKIKLRIMYSVIVIMLGIRKVWLKIYLLMWVELVLFIFIVVSRVGQVGRMNSVEIVVNEVIVVSGLMFSSSVVGINVLVVVVCEQSSVVVKNSIIVSSYG